MRMTFTTSSNVIKKLLKDTDTSKNLWGTKNVSQEEKLNQCHLQTPKDVKPHVCCMLQIPVNPALYSKTKKGIKLGSYLRASISSLEL